MVQSSAAGSPALRPVLDGYCVWGVDYGPSFFLQPLEIGAFMLDAFLLQQDRIFIVSGEGGGGHQIADVQHGGVAAAHEVYQVAG